jgi:hypothetical protein
VGLELGDAPDAPRADPGAPRQPVQGGSALAPHQGVARIRTLGKGHELETLGRPRREVLGAVHGHVRAPVEKGLLDLLHEQSLAADLREGDVSQAIARGLERHQRDFDAELGLHARRHGARLGQGEIAAPSRQTNRRHSVSDSSERRPPAFASSDASGSSSSPNNTRVVSSPHFSPGR